MTKSDLNNVRNEQGEQLKKLFDCFLLPLSIYFYYLVLSALKTFTLTRPTTFSSPPFFLCFIFTLSRHGHFSDIKKVIE